MTPIDLKEKLTAAGWKMEKQFMQDTGCDWYAWHPNREDVPDCACNDKPPSIVVTPWSMEIGGKLHSSVEITICGELPNGRWVDFKVYSVPMAEAMDALEPARKALFAAWTAAVEASK